MERSLGLSADDGDVDEIVVDLIAAALRETFDSVCNREQPDPHVVDDTGRTSRCVRHEEGYDSPVAVVDRIPSRSRD